MRSLKLAERGSGLSGGCQTGAQRRGADSSPSYQWRFSKQSVVFIETQSNGKQRALDANGRTLGFFDPQQGTTKEATQRTIAHGNLLASLIFDAN